MRRILAGVAGLLALAALGCHAEKRHVKLDLPREEVAEVRGCDAVHGAFGPEFHVTFQSVDGEELRGRFEEGLPQVLDLLPGEHRLVCHWVAISSPERDRTSGTEWVDLVVNAGRVYEAELYWKAGRESVRFHEVVPESREAARARRDPTSP